VVGWMQGTDAEHEQSNKIQQITFNSFMLCMSVGECYLTVKCVYIFHSIHRNQNDVYQYIHMLNFNSKCFPIYATEWWTKVYVTTKL
jgi:hypothetical protein